MSGREKMQKIIYNFCSRCHMGPIELDDANCAYFAFDNKIFLRVDMNETTDECTLLAYAGGVEKYSPNIYKFLLSQNLFWKGTGGAKLGLEKSNNDEDLEVLTISQRLPMDGLDEDQFYSEAEMFVNCVEKWLELMPKLDENDPKSIPTDKEVRKAKKQKKCNIC